MMASQQWLDVVSNNLANVNTVGFKRDGIVFHDWMERSLNSNGGAGERVGTLGAGPTATKMYTAWTVGTLSTTDNPLDVAIITDEGLFAVQLPARPGESEPQVVYTRDGAFQYGEGGMLVTRSQPPLNTQYPVLDQNLQPIYLDPTRPATIDEKGNVGPLIDGNGANAQIGLFRGDFTKLGSNLYEGREVEPFEAGRVQQRALEGSNVNTVETMIQMITVSRAFELAQKAITTQDENNGRLLEVLRGT